MDGKNCGGSFQLNQGRSPVNCGEQSMRVNNFTQRSGGRESGAKVTDLQSEAACLVSEGAQLQYLAFGKIRAGVSDAIRLLKTHDTLGAINALERVEQVVDLHLDVVKRAGSAPGMWPVATLYEKMKLVETSDAKDDKIWAECLSQAIKARFKVEVSEKRPASDAAGGSATQFRRYS
jgi:hypothetical protein